MKTFTKESLTQTIGEVENALEAMLKSEVESLKAKQAKLAKNEDAPEGMVKEEGKPDESAPPAEASAPPADASAPPGGDPAASAPDASAAPGGDPAAQGAAPTSPQDLAAAYAELSPEERAMHLQALQQAMAQTGDQGGAPGGAPAPGAAPAPMGAGSPQPPMASPAAPAAPMPGEGSAPLSPGSEMALKSELSAMKVSHEELKKNFDLVSQALVSLVKVPQRKAVTGKDVVPVAAPAVDPSKLSKNEVTAKLKKVAANPELKKSDRDLIKKFYKQEVKVADLAHLLQ